MHTKMAHTDSNEYFKKNTSKCTKTAHFDATFDQLRLRKMFKIVATDVRFYKDKTAPNSILAGAAL